MTPCFWAKRTRRSRARCISLASVGKVTAFSWTVVSTITCWKSAGLAAPARAPVRVATGRLSCKALLDEGDQPLLAHPLAQLEHRVLKTCSAPSTCADARAPKRRFSELASEAS